MYLRFFIGLPHCSADGTDSGLNALWNSQGPSAPSAHSFMPDIGASEAVVRQVLPHNVEHPETESVLLPVASGPKAQVATDETKIGPLVITSENEDEDRGILIRFLPSELVGEPLLVDFGTDSDRSTPTENVIFRLLWIFEVLCHDFRGLSAPLSHHVSIILH